MKFFSAYIALSLTPSHIRIQPLSHSLKPSYILIHPLPHSHTLPLTFTHIPPRNRSHPLTFAYTPSHIHPHPISHSHSLLSHSPIPSLTFSYSPSHFRINPFSHLPTLSLTFAHALSHSPTHTLSHIRPHPLSHSPTLSLTFAHTLSHIHPNVFRCVTELTGLVHKGEHGPFSCFKSEQQRSQVALQLLNKLFRMRQSGRNMLNILPVMIVIISFAG
jgi:hypothetical protein